ncbi:hypothetical protein W97_01046 [Coniosporium apollinis CBS 100218]|uniref:BTB domain-containing protein n=1 Tax=Coniosporium apollinis (strain CBS 100218) TaxID=1168221 RepID=R7YIW2_CONA1|nr:uncharacterized protein W97_01046 [Coniosporium apollinis CBS 100218]EON61828.1 hypothetical protein W97_01046 [Coniosporium apollinis CBS 100218]
MADENRSEAPKVAEPSFYNLGATVVTIHVGTGRVPFAVHKDLLCYYSAYFQKLFNGSFREAKDLLARAEDTTVSTFGYFMQWLYTQTFVRYKMHAWERVAISTTDHYANSFNPPYLHTLLDLYIFADRYDIRLLRNDVMRSWQKDETDWDEISDEDIIIKAFDNLPHGSPLCRYIAQYYVALCGRNLDSDEEFWSKLPKGFLYEVVRILTKRLNSDYKFDQESCDFHEHEDDDEKSMCTNERKLSEDAECGF